MTISEIATTTFFMWNPTLARFRDLRVKIARLVTMIALQFRMARVVLDILKGNYTNQELVEKVGKLQKFSFRNESLRWQNGNCFWFFNLLKGAPVPIQLVIATVSEPHRSLGIKMRHESRLGVTSFSLISLTCVISQSIGSRSFLHK